MADKLSKAIIYKELERKTHETWTCTNEYDKRPNGKSWQKPEVLWDGKKLWLGLFSGNTTDTVFPIIWKALCRQLSYRDGWYCSTEIFRKSKNT